MITILAEFDQEKFNLEVENLLDKGISYIEAIIEWCEINEVELDIIASMIKKMPENKARMAAEAKKKFLLKD